VPQSDGQDLKAQQFERFARCNSGEGQPGCCVLVRVSAGVCEGVRERLANLVFDRLFAVDGDGGMQSKAEDAQVIDPHDVVGVGVSHDGSPDQ